MSAVVVRIENMPEHTDHPEPWAMQLVVRRNKQAPANHFAVLEAAGSAVVKLLADQRTVSPAGQWYCPVQHWRAGWIRKVVRRAENKRWDDVQVLPGVNATSGTAEVRAFVPGPLSPLPLSLKKLQVGGTQFPRVDETTQQHHAIVTVELTPHLELSTGKAAAQVGHAAQLAFEQLTSQADDDPAARAVLESWSRDDFRIAVVSPCVADWDRQQRPVSVVDAGLTEIAQAAETARAVWS